ncbi:MAG TPA: NADH-quinone oxidoreductase subunit N [Daejeonella sp.]|nr:NADH-quinone oxidoreductase subunit N [Daejeonella sp.]
MSGNDLYALVPLLILAASSVLVMLLIALKLSHRLIQLFSLLLFGIAFLSLFFISPDNIQPLLIIDGFSIFIMGLNIFSALVVNILSYIYFDEKEENPKEYYVLLFLCTLGACVLAVSQHFISFFLGLEILTIGLYALIAYLRGRHHPIEAGIKYLILAAFSSAFLLFGMALIYLQSGQMQFLAIAHHIVLWQHLPPFFIIGMSMMLVGIGFKLGIVPFHMWTADVYQGAPAPVTAFIATVSKGGVFAVLFRFFITINVFRFQSLILVMIFIAIASMIVGNLLALNQNNVKRILAYSSIAHLGYLLVAFISGNSLSLEAVSFYLLAYFITTLGAFGVITLLSNRQTDAEDIESFQALFWRQPVLACVFTACLLSLAGIPLTAGFIGKFYVLAAGLQSGFWEMAIILVLSSVIGLYYYLRIITRMFSVQKDIVTQEKKAHPFFYLLSSVALSFLTLLILWFGIFPAKLMALIEQFSIR